MIRIGTVLAMVALAGCGKATHTDDEIARGKQALVASLDSWKNKEPVETLKSRPESIEFSEDLRKANELIEYTILATETADSKVVSFRTKLSIKDKKGKTTEREFLYSVDFRTPLRVFRDPYN